VELPTRGSWGFESDVPAGYHELVGDGGWSFCPECGLAYRLEYEEEFDVTSHFESWSLQRLTPREAAEKLTGARGEAARAAREGWLEGARQWLESGNQEARRLGVWILVDEATASADGAALEALLDHPDGVVSEAALSELRDLAKAGRPIATSAAALVAALDHPEDSARRCAAVVLTRLVRDQGPEGLAPLLTSEDPVVLLAFVGELRSLMHHGDPITDLLEPLEALRRHPDEFVRSHVSWAIAAAPPSPQGQAIQERQAEELSGKIANPETSFEAQCRLDEVIRAGVDVSHLIPEFFQALVASPPVTGDYARILAALLDADLDVSEYVGEVLQSVADSRSNVGNKAMDLLEALVEQGADVAPHRERILPHLGKLTGYQSERIGRFVAEALLRHRALEEVATLLGHSHDSFRSGVQDSVIARVRPGAGYPERQELRGRLDALTPDAREGFLRRELGS
jgi:hypothetical protein